MKNLTKIVPQNNGEKEIVTATPIKLVVKLAFVPRVMLKSKDCKTVLSKSISEKTIADRRISAVVFGKIGLSLVWGIDDINL